MAQPYPKQAGGFAIPAPANDNWKGPRGGWSGPAPANDNTTFDPPGWDRARKKARRFVGIGINPATYLAGWIWSNFQGLGDEPVGYELAFPGTLPSAQGWPQTASCRNFPNFTHIIAAGSTYCGPQGDPTGWAGQGISYTIQEFSTYYYHGWSFQTYRQPSNADPYMGNDPVWRFYRQYGTFKFVNKSGNPDAGKPQPLPFPSPLGDPIYPTVTVPRPHPALRPMFPPMPSPPPVIRGPKPDAVPRPMPPVNPWPTPELPVVPRPAPAPRLPSKPPKGTKEKKATLTVSNTPVGWVLNIVTESLDILNCAYKAIPGKGIPPRWDPTRYGGQGGWRRASPQQITDYVYTNALKMDVGKFITCLIENQVEDRIIGAIGDLTRRANSGSGRFAGVAFGPAL